MIYFEQLPEEIQRTILHDAMRTTTDPETLDILRNEKLSNIIDTIYHGGGDRLFLHLSV